MTVFSVALFSEHPEGVSFAGAARNLVWVTLGNAVAGAVLMGFGYWLVAGRPRIHETEEDAPLSEEAKR